MTYLIVVLKMKFLIGIQFLIFKGETGPYIQYTYVRTKSVLEKSGVDINNILFDMVNLDNLEDSYSQNIIKLLYDFHKVLVQVTEKVSLRYYLVI